MPSPNCCAYLGETFHYLAHLIKPVVGAVLGAQGIPDQRVTQHHNRGVALGILVQHVDLCFPFCLGLGSHHEHAHHLQRRVHLGVHIAAHRLGRRTPLDHLCGDLGQQS